MSASKQLSARERARAAAAAFRERQDRLEVLAVEYFTAHDQIDRDHEVRDREIRAAEKKAEAASAGAERAADAVIRSMLELGVGQPEIRERLGCSSADIRRATSSPDPDAAGPDRGESASAEQPAY